MSFNYASVGELKVGSYVLIDGEPCRVVEISKAKTGKHGSAKANVIAVGIFTGNKRTIMAPVDTRVEVPIIEKRMGQIISDRGNTVEIMDLETYETFEVDKPTEEDIASKIKPQAEAEYWVVAGRKKIVRVK